MPCVPLCELPLFAWIIQRPRITSYNVCYTKLLRNNWAYLWYSIADRRGVKAAQTKKESVASKLQPVEIEQADRQVQSILGGGR